MNLERFIEALSEYSEECSSNPHSVIPEIRFFVGNDEIQLDFDGNKENENFAIDAVTYNCGCWVGIDIRFRKRDE